MIDALERLPRLLGRCDRHRRRSNAGVIARAPASEIRRRSAERIGAPDQPQQRDGDDGAATINCVCNRGNTESRNENVSRSMIRKSRNVSESCRMSNLKRDSAIKQHHEGQRQRRADARAAAAPDSNRQFANTHASSDSVIANGPYSVASRTAQRRQMQRGDHADTVHRT